MVNQKMLALGAEPSAIRQLFAYGLQRKAEIGADAVFDYSIGNPSVPTPDVVTEAIRALTEIDPVAVHGYTPTVGDPETRTAIAASLQRRFGGGIAADNILMTDGASTSLSIVFRAITEGGAGDQIIIPTPFFPEYRTWVEADGAELVCVPSRTSDFQLDIPAMEAAINEHTRGVIVNSPNNPVGVVYTPENLQAFTDVLRAKSHEYGHPIYLISDEPYRELVYGGNVVSWMPDLYDNTIVCYSWSKSLSLPGERIGYVLVPPCVEDWRTVFTSLCGAARSLGFICAGSLFQKVVARCCDVMPNVEPYERNRELLTALLDECGFEYIQPQGAFYLWMKALEPDAQAFSDRAKAHELLLVPSDSFGVTGWVRLGYCVAEKTIVDSKNAFKALRAEYR